MRRPGTNPGVLWARRSREIGNNDGHGGNNRGLTSQGPPMPRAVLDPPPRSTRKAAGTRARKVPSKNVDLDSYAPAYFTWIANKLSSGASRAYRSTFAVGIETWRLLVTLAIEPAASASRMCEVIGMDKASVSRALKSMQSQGLITVTLDDQDGRLRVARITAKGRALHDQIAGVALERQRALLSVLDGNERRQLMRLLHKLHENLPTVETATERYLASHYPRARKRRAPRAPAA